MWRYGVSEKSGLCLWIILLVTDMEKPISIKYDAFWIPKGMEATVETYLSDELPPIGLCASSYALVWKDDALLQTDLRKGERAERTLDVPGGHIDQGETPEQAAARETFEETGVRVCNPRLVAYKKITIHSPKPEGYRYAYPISYMLYYRCDVAEETPFAGNHETHGRVWLSPEEYEKSRWWVGDKEMVDAIVKK